MHGLVLRGLILRGLILRALGVLTLRRAGLLVGRVLVHRAGLIHPARRLLLGCTAGLHGAASLADGALLLSGFTAHRAAALGGAGRLRVLRRLRASAATAVAVHGALCVRQTGAGDERERGDRDHKAVRHGILLTCFSASLPAPTTKGGTRSSGTLAVPRHLFVERQMNARARFRRNEKAGFSAGLVACMSCRLDRQVALSAGRVAAAGHSDL